ncbi:uncharacterized protein LOC123544209 [Mercenaria mercenaria]|uniref:uncharacterized protein LOC123544209 n=1 Tax=Mercenaria mercenaria TaxID=6596 RepID=UPI00234ED54F|nr:uncharacterized protein LOC123544209 [Mercenaria mercenaria]
MKAFLFFISLFYMVICKKETVSDLYDMLNDPAILSEIEKRLKLIDDDSEPFSDGQVGCYEKTATLAPGCSFIANSSLIIKTSESMQRGAEFLEDFKNISCPRECTKRCCENPKCDTAVYQDKDARKCFLFHCGDSGVCLFSHHSNYWRMSISEATHKSHGYIPGGATYIHEDELENLGSHDKQQDTTPEPVPTTTTTRPTTSLPGLGDYCASYESDCEDPHAECLMKTCRCRVGYHEKNQVCRKHCRVNEEFECENIKYGANGRQCVLSRYVCDGHPDCDDGSDEMNCPDKNKPAYMDGDGNSNVYNSPLYNSQYNQPDAQFPYGFPIPGLTNQQQAGLYPSPNQIYPAQGTASQNVGGQFYVPGMTNQNNGGANLVPVKNQYNQQWPLNSGIGSQIYPNNVPYQAGQQQSYIPAQTGLIQNPVQPVPQVNQNMQPVQQTSGQGIPQVQSNLVPSGVVQQNYVPVQNPATSAPVVKPVTQKSKVIEPVNQIKNQYTGFPNDQFYDTDTVTEGEEVARDRDRYPVSMNDDGNDNVNSYDDRNPDIGQKVPPKTDLQHNYAYDEGRMESQNVDKGDDDNPDNAVDHHRHSSEEEDDVAYNRARTYPPSTKTKTQIASPTQSTVSGQKTGQSHSEGFPDYSWLKYDDDSPRVSGKKGKTVASSHGTDKDTSDTRKQPSQSNVKSTSGKSSKLQETKQNNYIKPSAKLESDSRYDTDKLEKGRYDVDSRYPDDYRLPYDDYQRPSNNRRPSYNRYDNRYDNSRRRPSPGSRYPYYETGYKQGWNRDRERYPVWDPYKDEYYYPDVYEDRHLSHDLDYDGPADKKPSHSRPFEPGNKNGIFQGQPDTQKVTEPPHNAQKTTEKVVKQSTPKAATPSPTDAVKPVATDTNKVDAPKIDSQASTDTDESDNQEPVSSEQETGDQSVEESSPVKSNNTQRSKVVNQKVIS